jgi:hypothetical protein
MTRNQLLVRARCWLTKGTTGTTSTNVHLGAGRLVPAAKVERQLSDLQAVHGY